MTMATEKQPYANCGKLILDQRELLRLLDEGLKRAEIARRFGVDRSAITKSLRRMEAAEATAHSRHNQRKAA